MDKKRALKQLKEIEKHSYKAKEKGMRLAAESWNAPWKILISTIMSARTRDEVTIPIASKLFKKYPSVKKLSKAKLSEVRKIIKPVNFYKNKSRNVLNTAKKIINEFNGKTPREFDKLLTLPGVGRKTANVYLSELGKPEIGIDTHVSYISRKLRWTSNKSQKKIEEDLKALFPKRYWKKLNATLVRFGKTYTSRKEKDKLLEQIKKLR